MSRQHLDRACKKTASKPLEIESVDLSPTFESNLDEAVSNIHEESKKCNYNPEIDMNWCNLPTKMRYECVKRMGFKNRCRLREVSKSEKSLVDGRKHQFDLVRLDFDTIPEEWTLEPFSQKISFQNERKTKKAEEFFAALFKNSEIKSFCIKGSLPCCRINNDPKRLARNRIDKQLTKYAPFQFERASVFGNTFVSFFIDNCPTLKKFDLLGGNVWRFSLGFLAEKPNILNIEEFRIADVPYRSIIDFLEKLVQKWIDNDSEVGKSVQFVVTADRIVEAFASKFDDRIIEKTAKIVRIRMNNDTTQVMLKIIGSRHDSFLYGNELFDYCSCKVIPIDMPESEYETGDGWIQAIFENGLKEDGKLENPVEFDAEDQAVWRHRFPC